MKRFNEEKFARWLKKTKAASSLIFVNDVLVAAESSPEPDIDTAASENATGLKYAEAVLGLARAYASTNDERLTPLCSNIRNALYWNGEVNSAMRKKYVDRLNLITQGLTATLSAQSLALASADNYMGAYKFAFGMEYPDPVRRELLYRWIHSCKKPGDFRKLFKVILPQKPARSAKPQIVQDGFFIKLILYRMKYRRVFKKTTAEKHQEKRCKPTKAP